MLRTLGMAVVALALSSVSTHLGAADMQPVHSGRYGILVSSSSLALPKLAPGLSGTGTFMVQNNTQGDATLRMRATRVSDMENSCILPEQREPTEGCETDGGELAEWLSVTITHKRHKSVEVLWSGRLEQLRRGVVLSRRVPAKTSWPLGMSIGLPWAAGNDTMTDSVSFDLRVDAACGLRSYTSHGPQVRIGGTKTAVGSHAVGLKKWLKRSWQASSWTVPMLVPPVVLTRVHFTWRPF